MKRRLIISLFAAAIISTGAYRSFAEMPEWMDKTRCGMPGDDMPMMREIRRPGPVMMEGMMLSEHFAWDHLMELSLDEKQKKEIEVIRSKLLKDTVRKTADIHIARIEIKEILDKDPIDMKAAEVKLRQIESLMTDMRLTEIKALQEANAKLTPKQIKSFKEIPQRHRRPMPDSRGMAFPFEEKGDLTRDHMRYEPK